MIAHPILSLLSRSTTLKFTKPLISTAWLVIEKIISLALSLIITLAIARHLLPESFGKMSYLLALASLVTPLMAVGLNTIVSREVIKRPNDSDKLVGTAIALRCLASLIIAPMAILWGYLYLAVDERSLFAFLTLTSVFNATLVIDFWLQAHVANRFSAMVRLSALLFFSAARILAIYIEAELVTFVLLAGLEVAFVGLLYLLVYHKLSNGILSLHFSREEAWKLLRDSRWLLLSGVAAIVYLKIDQVMLGIMIDDQAVGIYAAAARISEVAYFIPAAIVTSFFPQLVLKRAEDTLAYEGDLQRLNDALFCGAIAIVGGVTIAAPWMIPMLFGEAYAAAVPVLVVHIWAGVFVFMRALLSKWLIAENLLKLSFLSQLLGALINVLLNVKLIPLYGPVGAAYATVASLLVASYAVLFLHRDLWPMAWIVTNSIFLPVRLARNGRNLYCKYNRE